MKRDSRFQIVNIFFTLLTLTVNGLANALPINGKGTGEISDQFNIYFVPEGYVFIIWGVIYLALLAFTVYQALGGQRESSLLRRISPWYWLACAANSVWIFLWHYEIFPATLVAMVTLLVSLIVIYLALRNSDMSTVDRIWIKLPFSIYLGWITVATVANVTQVLYYFEWAGWGISEQTWGAIMLIVATLIGLGMLMRECDIAFNLVLVWAFIGIAVKHSDTVLVSNTAILTSALLFIGIFAIGIGLLRQRI